MLLFANLASLFCLALVLHGEFYEISRIRNLRRIKEFKNNCKVDWILTRGIVRKVKTKYIGKFQREKDGVVFSTGEIDLKRPPTEDSEVWYNSQLDTYSTKKMSKFDEKIEFDIKNFKPYLSITIETNYGVVTLESNSCPKDGIIDIYKNPFTLEYDLDSKPKFLQEEKFMTTIPVEIKPFFLNDDKISRLHRPINLGKRRKIALTICIFVFLLASLIFILS